MTNFIVGCNGQGKTLYLYHVRDKLIKDGVKVISNIPGRIQTKSFNEERLGLLLSNDAYEDIFHYHEIIIANGALSTNSTTEIYTSAFLDTLTLLAREGDTLILDEPDKGLIGAEEGAIAKIFERLLPTFRDSYIVLHNQNLFGLSYYIDIQFHLVNDYSIQKITRRELNEHIGSM